MARNPKLKPCSVCGGPSWLWKSMTGLFAVTCQDSKCSSLAKVYGGAKAEAVERWNTRQPVKP